MTLYENRASEEVSGLPEVVHAGPKKPEPSTVLLENDLQEGQQSLASGALASEAREPKLLARPERGRTSSPVAQGESGLLEEPPAQRPVALQDDIARPTAIW
jgi:hypothetical protein